MYRLGPVVMKPHCFVFESLTVILVHSSHLANVRHADALDYIHGFLRSHGVTKTFETDLRILLRVSKR